MPNSKRSGSFRITAISQAGRRREPGYRPNPTPTPDDQTAAPAKPAGNGSNPVDLLSRVEMKYQFQNFAGGYMNGVPVIRGDYAFTHKLVKVTVEQK